MRGVTTGGAGSAAQNWAATSHREDQPSPAQGPKRFRLARAASEALAPGWSGGEGQAEARVRPRSHTDEPLQVRTPGLTCPREPNPTHSSQRRLGTGRQPGSLSLPDACPNAGRRWHVNAKLFGQSPSPPSAQGPVYSLLFCCPPPDRLPRPCAQRSPVSMTTPFPLPLGAHRRPQ